MQATLTKQFPGLFAPYKKQGGFLLPSHGVPAGQLREKTQKEILPLVRSFRAAALEVYRQSAPIERLGCERSAQYQITYLMPDSPHLVQKFMLAGQDDYAAFVPDDQQRRGPFLDQLFPPFRLLPYTPGEIRPLNAEEEVLGRIVHLGVAKLVEHWMDVIEGPMVSIGAQIGPRAQSQIGTQTQYRLS